MASPPGGKETNQDNGQWRHLVAEAEKGEGEAGESISVTSNQLESSSSSPRDTKSEHGEFNEQFPIAHCLENQATGVDAINSPDGVTLTEESCSEKTIECPGTVNHDSKMVEPEPLSEPTDNDLNSPQDISTCQQYQNAEENVTDCIDPKNTVQNRTSEQKSFVTTHTQTCSCHLPPNSTPMEERHESWVNTDICENSHCKENQKCVPLGPEVRRGIFRSRTMSEKSVSFDLEDESNEKSSKLCERSLSSEYKDEANEKKLNMCDRSISSDNVSDATARAWKINENNVAPDNKNYTSEKTQYATEKDLTVNLENNAHDAVDTASVGCCNGQLPVTPDDVTMTSSVVNDDTERLVDDPAGNTVRYHLWFAIFGLFLCPVTGLCAVRYAMKAREARSAGNDIRASHNSQKAFLLTVIGAILAFVITVCVLYLILSNSNFFM